MTNKTEKQKLLCLNIFVFPNILKITGIIKNDFPLKHQLNKFYYKEVPIKFSFAADIWSKIWT